MKMLSKNEMKAVERFIKFIDDDEDYIKYNLLPIIKGQRIWGVKVVIFSSACEKMETLVRIEDMLTHYDDVCEHVMTLAKRLERNIFCLS
jgi:hypothetical protein